MSARLRTVWACAMAALVAASYVFLALVQQPVTEERAYRPARPPAGTADFSVTDPDTTVPAAAPDPEVAEIPVASSNVSTAVAALNAWSVRYRDSQDYFEFVSEAAVAAEAGDGRAAFHVSRVVEICTHYTGAYGREVDPEMSFLNGQSGVQEWVRTAKHEEFRRCARFFDEDPFVFLPQRTGGYPAEYWRELAEETDDPLVQALQAWQDVGIYSYDDDGAAKSVKERIEANLRSAIVSKDPDALYSVGELLANSRMVTDPLRGIAWMILACQGGYDCSAQNFEHRYAICAVYGRCPPDAPWTYYFERTLGPESYARAYEIAREYAALMARDDWAGLEPSWTLDTRRERPGFVQASTKPTISTEPVVCIQRLPPAGHAPVPDLSSLGFSIEIDTGSLAGNVSSMASSSSSSSWRGSSTDVLIVPFGSSGLSMAALHDQSGTLKCSVSGARHEADIAALRRSRLLTEARY